METAAQGLPLAVGKTRSNRDACDEQDVAQKEPITQAGAKPTTELNVAWEEPKYTQSRRVDEAKPSVLPRERLMRRVPTCRTLRLHMQRMQIEDAMQRIFFPPSSCTWNH